MLSSRVLPLAALFLIAVGQLAADEAPDPRSITVNGRAELQVVPDEVILTTGVETFDLDLEVAKTKNDKRVTALLQATDSLGIPRERVRTDYLNIQPLYDDGRRDREFLGYLVRKTIAITLRDIDKCYLVRKTIAITLREIDKFENLLTSTLEAGANYIHGVDFRTTELRKHRDKARELAIIAAREKAQDLAKELGQSVGQPRSISEGYSGWWSHYGSWWGSRWGGAMAQNVMQVAGPASGDMEGPTAPGRIAVTATVTVSFALLD
jgi:uncharacterized protein YggE